MQADSDISDIHIPISFQFPSIPRMEIDRIRMEMDSDISDIYFFCFLTVSISIDKPHHHDSVCVSKDTLLQSLAGLYDTDDMGLGHALANKSGTSTGIGL